MTVSNARLIAELQAVTLGIHLVGLDRLSEVMNPALSVSPDGYDGEAGMHPEKPQQQEARDGRE